MNELWLRILGSMRQPQCTEVKKKASNNYLLAHYSLHLMGQFQPRRSPIAAKEYQPHEREKKRTRLKLNVIILHA